MGHEMDLDIVVLYELKKWDKVFKSGLSKFFKGCLPHNLLSPLLNTLSQMISSVKINKFSFSEYPVIVRCERKRVRYFETLW